ncbi:hypothetical protein [Actinoplanes awajinensis]|uniref:Tat (Twin-arginine translocation) pathway signal sequence n=1 Tax=Actinoplanes awajinensis subsp. mycoplanecinus TaxID=135947 RepID=A0A124G9D2_9ACTN|nr:hypothetical protein [Actinoplanes awajinensis]KUL28781.1 hypothetical protein ADL15_31055 [Actinoplanes awajinensis subsp. mycoplanecinus]
MTSTSSLRAVPVLGALAAVFLTALVAAPGALAGAGPTINLADPRNLSETFREAFAEYWSSGERTFAPELQETVDFWFRYHVTKGVFAGLLLLVLIPLVLLLGRAFLRAGGRALAAAGVLVSGLALLAVATVLANIQGAVAPFASLLSLLPGSEGDPVTRRLAGSAGDRAYPPLAAMIDDFGRYHAAMAVLAPITALLLAGVSVLAWRAFGRAARAGAGSADVRRGVGRARRVFGALGLVGTGSALALIVVGVANMGVASDPAPALLAFFQGGW